MKFKIDENLPAELARDLERLGHSADTVADEGLVGAADSVIVEAANAGDRIVLTLDKGIADIVRFPAQLDHLLRLDLTHRVTVVTDERIRMR